MVSIVIPTYGGPKYLSRAIQSVLNQTYLNWELIIVDDNGIGSEMQIQTQMIMSEYRYDSRIRYVCHDVNKNGSAARNTGVSNSKGDMIALLDDDDEYNYDFLERQVSALLNLSEDYALVYCSHKTFYKGEHIETYTANAEDNILFDILVHDVEIATTSILIRRECYEAVGGFDESFRRHQDWEFIARIASKYLVKANDFIGYNRYLEWRNVPSSPVKAKAYREHYLNKMRPYIKLLPEKQQRIVIISNRLDVALWFLKDKQIIQFLREYRQVRPGYLGVKYLFNRFKLVLSRRRFKLV